jgi:hypothetical protein
MAWDLRLYLGMPAADLMGTGTGCRSFQAPWYIDLPDINLNNEDRVQATQRMGQYMDTSGRDGTRITRIWVSRSREARRCRSGRSQS